MRLFAIALVGCAASEPAPSPPTTPPAVTTIAADAGIDAARSPVFDVEVMRSGTANDDFPHRSNEMRVALADAQTCVPKPEPAADDEMPDHQISLAIDAIGGDLVVCAQALTRRDVSVFLDMVSYACWNVDPRTAFLTRRRDLARSYFDCQDGSCADDSSQISFDGKSRIEVTDSKLRVVDREAGAVHVTIATDYDAAHEAWTRGDLVYVSNMLFAHVDDSVFVYDDRGAKIATLPGRITHVVSDHAVVAILDDTTATAFDLRTRATRKLTVPECSPPGGEERVPRCVSAVAATHFDAVEFRGAFYAMDHSKRRLVVVDPKTFRERSAKQLAICK